MKKLGIKWWLTFVLGLVLGVVIPLGGLTIYNHFAWESIKRDLFYTDKNLKMNPGIMGENEYVIVEMVEAAVESNEFGGASMILKLTNKTVDPVTVSLEYSSMNGYAIGGSVYEELQPLASVETTMIVNDNLFDYDIEKVMDVTIGIVVYHDRDAEGNSRSFYGPYTAYSKYSTSDYDQEKVDKEKNKGPLVYDDNNIKITVLEDRYETDSYAPYQWLLIENNNNFAITTISSEVEINGVIISNSSFYTLDPIGPNTKCKKPIILDMSDAEKAKNPKIESIVLYTGFQASEYDSPYADFRVEIPKLKIK